MPAPRTATTLTLLCAACSAPEVIPERVDPEGATRIEWQASTGLVSALRSGEEGARRIVFVHGTPGDATNWSPYLDPPLEGVELIAMDRPGFGRSEPKTAVPSLAEQAAAVAPALVERGGHWPVLVGHSLGGPIVLRVAADYPERVTALVILAGNVDPAIEDLRWYNYAGRVVTPFLSREMRNSNAELFPHRAELEELEPLLRGIRCPVYIIHGTDDGLVPYSNAPFLQQALTSSARVELTTLDGDDHFFIWTRPEVVRGVLGRALE